MGAGAGKGNEVGVLAVENVKDIRLGTREARKGVTAGFRARNEGVQRFRTSADVSGR